MAIDDDHTALGQVAALTAAAAKLQVGDPLADGTQVMTPSSHLIPSHLILADGTQMGPLVSAMQRDRVRPASPDCLDQGGGGSRSVYTGVFRSQEPQTGRAEGGMG
jgi:acyl-CoA reductase-like NAD-dependent aldehyde dehydrogenase